MSYNMIDFTLFDKLDCSAESHFHKTFASYHKYKLVDVSIPGSSFEIKFNLVHEIGEANDSKYAEIVINKSSTISYTNLYGSNPYEKLFKGLDSVLGSYYVVEWDGNTVYTFVAKDKGKIPNLQTPLIDIASSTGIHFRLITDRIGNDTDVYVPNDKQSVIHLPITTFGPKYTTPVIGDRLIFVDSIEQRDRTFTREVVNVEKHAKCTCDVITLDSPIDRLESTHSRINGLGMPKDRFHSNNYTASFDKVKVYKRKDNYQDILRNRGTVNNICTIPIDDRYNMSVLGPKIANEYIKRSENPHLGATMKYFGGVIHWREFEDELAPIYQEFGQYLRDHLFLLTSNRQRPEYLLHIDYDLDDPNVPVVGSLTWPVLNCSDDTVTVWYDCYRNGEKIYQYGKQDVVITDESLKLVEIDRYYFNTAEFNSVILKHDDWHTLYNNANQESNRMLLQWRFKPEYSWDFIKEITKKLWRNPGI